MSGTYDDLLLPANARLIHIGPQKTGSTTIQKSMAQSREDMRAHGVLYPGPSERPAEALAWGLGTARPRGAAPAKEEAWLNLLRQVDEAADLRMCLSHEALGRANDRQIDKLVSTIGGERPHVLAVARRYDSYLPSQWQQRVKARETLTYDEWLRVVLLDGDASDPVWRNVWRPHDTLRLVERWTKHVGADNFTLVIADERDRDRLPRIFEGLLGLPEGLLTPDGVTTNRSLSMYETELLRQVNLHFDKAGCTDEMWFQLVLRAMIPQMVRAPYPKGDPRIPPLPQWARDRVVELSDQRLAGLDATGVRIIGDPEWLRVDPVGPATDPVSGEVEMVSLESAVRALEGLAKGGRKAVRAAERSERTVAKLRRRAAARKQQDRQAAALAQRSLPRRIADRLGRKSR